MGGRLRKESWEETVKSKSANLLPVIVKEMYVPPKQISYRSLWHVPAFSGTRQFLIVTWKYYHVTPRLCVEKFIVTLFLYHTKVKALRVLMTSCARGLIVKFTNNVNDKTPI